MLNTKQVYTPYIQKLEKTEDGMFVVFGDTRMGPYQHIYKSQNTLYIDTLQTRGSGVFPFPPKNGKTEIFLGIDTLLIACGKRKSHASGERGFLDLINNKELKYRLNVDEVNLIYSAKTGEKEVLYINYGESGKNQTVCLGIEDMKVIQIIDENCECDFNIINNSETLVPTDNENKYFQRVKEVIPFGPNDYFNRYFVSPNIKDIAFLLLTEKYYNLKYS